MNGLQRNQDAMKRLAGIKKLKQNVPLIKNSRQYFIRCIFAALYKKLTGNKSIYGKRNYIAGAGLLAVV